MVRSARNRPDRHIILAVVSPPVIVPPVIVEPGPVVVPPREPGDSGTPISSDPRARLVVLIAGLVTIAATVLVILAAIRS